MLIYWLSEVIICVELVDLLQNSQNVRIQIQRKNI